jgi:hypothetical protein
VSFPTDEERQHRLRGRRCSGANQKFAPGDMSGLAVQEEGAKTGCFRLVGRIHTKRATFYKVSSLNRKLGKPKKQRGRQIGGATPAASRCPCNDFLVQGASF